jgi:hypothetical protein
MSRTIRSPRQIQISPLPQIPKQIQYVLPLSNTVHFTFVRLLETEFRTYVFYHVKMKDFTFVYKYTRG